MGDSFAALVGAIAIIWAVGVGLRVLYEVTR
jgi:hypothetical protein